MENFLQVGRRYSGQITVERYCDRFGIDMEFDIVFSAHLKDAQDSKILLTEINPYQIQKILEKRKRFQLFANRDNQGYVINASVEKVDGDAVYAVVEKSNIYRDKRRFHRFHFCCRDLGLFEIIKNGSSVCTTACIFELSRSGTGIISPCIDSVSQGDIITVKGKDDRLQIKLKVLHIKNAGRYQILGGEIKEANINLINYIIKKYIKVSEEIILAG
ncbi:hypothetical protein [Persephonella sp.]